MEAAAFLQWYVWIPPPSPNSNEIATWDRPPLLGAGRDPVRNEMPPINSTPTPHNPLRLEMSCYNWTPALAASLVLVCVLWRPRLLHYLSYPSLAPKGAGLEETRRWARLRLPPRFYPQRPPWGTGLEEASLWIVSVWWGQP